MSNEQQGQQGQQPPPEPPRPNVRLAHGRRPVTVEGDVNIGGHGAISLPDEEAQKAGFYLDDEARNLLLTQYPRVYIPYKPIAVPVPAAQGQQGNTPDTNDQGQQGQGQGEEAQ